MMDPNATLRELREAVHKANTAEGPADYYRYSTRALDKIEALDSWLSKGGYLPDDWQR